MTSPPSTSVVMAAAVTNGCEPTDLPPLHDTIDPEALDALFAPRGPGHRCDHDGTEVRFQYAGLYVRVEGNGTVSVEPVDGVDSPR